MRDTGTALIRAACVRFFYADLQAPPCHTTTGFKRKIKHVQNIAWEAVPVNEVSLYILPHQIKKIKILCLFSQIYQGKYCFFDIQ